MIKLWMNQLSQRWGNFMNNFYQSCHFYPFIYFSETNESIILLLKNQTASWEVQNMRLADENRKLKEEQKHVEMMLKKFLSPGQLNRIRHPVNTHIRWSPEDIASAISLTSVSPKAYRHLRATGFPLAALSTLRNLATSLSLLLDHQMIQ